MHHPQPSFSLSTLSLTLSPPNTHTHARQVIYLRSIARTLSMLCRHKNPPPTFENVQQLLPSLTKLVQHDDKVVSYPQSTPVFTFSNNLCSQQLDNVPRSQQQTYSFLWQLSTACSIRFSINEKQDVMHILHTLCRWRVMHAGPCPM